MAQVNWGDPQTFWLNVTNTALGLIVVVCCLVVAAGIIRELAERRHKRARAAADLDRELHDLVNSYQIGMTMADGGEPLPPKDSAASDQDRKKKP
ncbi:MAG TPA: hypothetical protein VG672_29490 [Bryobacteraceae bacterium]|jgi:hypothetical protein|nr:hypothetical protein [Bryobacteraceae bacterium]